MSKPQGNSSDDARVTAELKSSTDPTASLRHAIYLVLVILAAGNMIGRIAAVNSWSNRDLESYRVRQSLKHAQEKWKVEGVSDEVFSDRTSRKRTELKQKLKLQRPFLSSNDRSRWAAVRALVEHGTFEIDDIIAQPGCDTIDKVYHQGRDGEMHYYSSKPPLLITMIAAEYYVINQLTGKTLAEEPYAIGRYMLVSINVLTMVIMFVLLAKMIDHFGQTDWSRIMAMATITFGSMLSPFAVVLNNHIVGAFSVTVSLFFLKRILADGDTRTRNYALAGLAAGFTAANELPALTFVALAGLILLIRDWKPALLAYGGGVAVVAAAFFATNYAAHESLRPPYMHRSETNATDNWYNYPGSYWNNPQGMDHGEPKRSVYAMHALIGHHGIFSLTPMWLLSAAGLGIWAFSTKRSTKELAILIAVVSVVCLVFYIGLRPQKDRNYGGMTSGFRWMFWCIPLWTVCMLPTLDRMARSKFARGFAMLLLGISALSASYPTWNPWTQPWIYQLLEYCGWSGGL